VCVFACWWQCEFTLLCTSNLFRFCLHSHKVIPNTTLREQQKEICVYMHTMTSTSHVYITLFSHVGVSHLVQHNTPLALPSLSLELLLSLWGWSLVSGAFLNWDFSAGTWPRQREGGTGKCRQISGDVSEIELSKHTLNYTEALQSFLHLQTTSFCLFFYSSSPSILIRSLTVTGHLFCRQQII